MRKDLEVSEHGVVRPRPDGIRARCMGPLFCPVCRAEMESLSPGEAAKARKRLGITAEEMAARYQQDPNAPPVPSLDTISERLQEAGNQAINARLEAIEKRVEAILGFTPDGSCPCRLIEVQCGERRETLNVLDRPMYLEPCEKHRIATGACSLQVGLPLRSYMPKIEWKK